MLDQKGFEWFRHFQRQFQRQYNIVDPNGHIRGVYVALGIVKCSVREFREQCSPFLEEPDEPGVFKPLLVFGGQCHRVVGMTLPTERSDQAREGWDCTPAVAADGVTLRVSSLHRSPNVT